MGISARKAKVLNRLFQEFHTLLCHQVQARSLSHVGPNFASWVMSDDAMASVREVVVGDLSKQLDAKRAEIEAEGGEAPMPNMDELGMTFADGEAE